jgi:hypothetical protein
VTAKDVSNNTITSYVGTITFTSTDGSAVLPGAYTFTTGAGADNGVRTFTNTVTLKTAWNQTVTAADSGKTGTSGTIVVSAGALDHITISTSPTHSVFSDSLPFKGRLGDRCGRQKAGGRRIPMRAIASEDRAGE